MPRHLAAAALFLFACASSTPPPAAPAPTAAEPAPPPAPAAEPAPSLSAPAAPVPAGWHPVETDAFRIAFPAPPTRDESVEQTDVGPSPTTMWSVEIGGAWFGISVNDFPAGTVASADPADVLNGARDGALGNVGATLIADRSVEIAQPGSAAPVPGLEYEGSSPQFDVVARMFLDGDRLYQLIMVYPKGTSAGARFEQFAGTFELR